VIRPESSENWCFGDIVADPNRLEVRRQGQVAELEPKALRVLFYLIDHRGRVVSKEELIREVWAGTAVTDNALTRVIAQIRKQLGDDARSPRYIQTASSAGYRFIAELETPPAGPEVSPVPQEGIARQPRRRWLRLSMAGAILMAAAIWAIRRMPVQAPHITALEQITTSVALDRWPAFSPDGSHIAFTSDRTGRYQIFVRSIVPGSSDQQITFDDLDNIQPAWSPKGDYIAYACLKRGGINIIPASGGTVRYRTNFGDSPQWSPDGRRLVFRDPGMRFNPAQDPIDIPDATLWLVDTADGDPVRLTSRGSPPGGHESPHWLSDGEHVIFETAVLIPPTTPRPDFNPAIVDVRNGTWKSIPFGSLRARNPIVSPDLKYLYFEVRFGAQPGLWRARMDAGYRAQPPEAVMPANGALIRDLQFNTSGTRLAFSHSNDESALWSVPLSATGDAAGEPRPLIREHVRRFVRPAFSPDGSRIAYTWIQGDSEWLKMIVYVANADGTGATAISPEDRQAFNPEWVDSNIVGYEVTKKEAATYWLKPLDGSPRPTDLRLDWAKSDNVRLHGTKVVANVEGADGRHVVVVSDLAGAGARVLTPASRNIEFPCWSPDGRWIAAREVVDGHAALVVFPATGGEIQTLVKEPAQSLAYDWSPDSRRISFASMQGGVWNVYWVNRGTREVRQLTHFATPSASVGDPAWSPRGDQIVFERYDQSANIYIANLR
jgi:Tol biopolymer transport system component/DNA-binding winged helix-turn-helix (wHTH) protein